MFSCIIARQIRQLTRLCCMTNVKILFTAGNRSYNNGSEEYNSTCYSKYCTLGLIGSTYLFYNLYLNKNAHAHMLKEENPIYKLEEIKQHNTIDKGVWVTYNGKVYDITKFVELHPGGKKIMLAAGGAIEPYWNIYNMHNSEEVKNLLEEYKIGIIDQEEISQSQGKSVEDPFSNDPRRHPALRPASTKPYNAEPPNSLLIDSFKTPNDLFYVRNHMPVPNVDVDKFQLTICDINNNTKTLTLNEIKQLPKVTVTTAIQCAGNRRSEMSKVKPVKGLNWGSAAIGNADWTGARLVDILAHCGIAADDQVRHIHLQGLDTGLDGVSYAASVPAHTALDPTREAIIAYEMNGEPLPRDHGAPLRAIVPGIVGARNVKWLGRIVLSDLESSSHWQQNDYKGLPPGADWDTADFSKAPAIQELPVTSAICIPEHGETVQLVDGSLNVQGYASSGGGRAIVRVDVSVDCGKTWHVADLNSGPADENLHRQWSWTLWKAVIPVTQDTNSVEIWAKAIDSSYNSQPESFEHIWNFRGVLSNAYHKITVKILY